MHDENKAWNKFLQTGSVIDYLSYCCTRDMVQTGKEAKNAADDRRSNNTGEEYKRR
ncbi:MAG TPA: hypothetical protein H9675_04815 [Firmicutes bacterium]|nr:hypothetical protein [Bacillota bacterium]